MIAISVSNDRQQTEARHESGPLILGRSQEGDSPRLVISDRYVSRDQLKIEPLGEGRVRVTNLGGALFVAERPGQPPADLERTATPETRELARGEAVELPLPVRLSAGYSVVDLDQVAAPAPADGLQTLARPILAAEPRQSQQPLAELGDSPAPETLTQWFERLLRVQQAAAGSDAFYQETARAVVDLIGLDRGLVMLRREDRWDVMARHARRDTMGPEFSRKVLEKIVDQRRTFFQGLRQEDRMQSLAGVEAVVASPIIGDDGLVIGAVYGCRDLGSSVDQTGVRPLEAQLMQLLAAAVSTGLARVTREAEAIRARVQFEQFFSHDLAIALEKNPELLEGQQREVTALFVDVRSFSRISETLGASKTYQLLHDVMDMLTDHVMSRGGVVIDYHGDGLAAMWNAPLLREDHAQQACEAALAMHQSLPDLNGRWQRVLGFPLRIGTGLNTGVAQVGNAGSSRRMKYGPLGHTVNLASRVEGATKQFGVRVLVTEATRGQIPREMPTRRICRVRVVGIQGDVPVYELQASPDRRWLALCDAYHRSLEHFEAGRLQEAGDALQRVLAEHPQDQASKVLLEVVQRQLAEPPPHQPIVELSSK